MISYRTTISLKIIFIILILVLPMALVDISRVQAQRVPERRTRVITVEYTQYHWWLARWKDDAVVCKLTVDHEGKPTINDVYQNCWQEVYQKWVKTEPCDQAGTQAEDQCGGYYFHQVGSNQITKNVLIKLPLPTVRVELAGCHSPSNSELCTSIPQLKFTAQEPLPNEYITLIQGRLNDIPFVCQENPCTVDLRPTDAKGISIEFWADSSYGDHSPQYRGRVRVADSGVSFPSTSSGWYVDLMSEDDNQFQGCSRIWNAFPTLGAPPEWLKDPQQAALLSSQEPLAFLAGKLIREGYVSASACQDYGLRENGYASQCGLEQARTDLDIWQNIFDPYIIEEAQSSGIPSTLLKRIFAQESQFWPGVLQHKYQEFGLGQLTELGADTTLLWNNDFYNQFCPLVLEDSTCEKGYAHLEEDTQALLRGAFLSRVKVDLPLTMEEESQQQIRTSISLFTETLLGNCRQVGHMIEDETNSIPGDISSYQDLWRFTLANYHSGSRCLSEAIIAVEKQEKAMTWKFISQELSTNCPNAVDYVKKITR